MTGPAFDHILRALEQAGHRVTMQGPNRARTWCTHDGADNPDGLSIVDYPDRVGLHCFTRECDPADILAALGLTVRDRYHNPKGAEYHYDDGRTVHRTPGKNFRQSGNRSGTPTLYRLANVRRAVAEGEPVYLVEGESDALALESFGVAATTAPQGAGNFAKVDVSPLAGADVVAIADRDEQGERWSRQVAAKLAGVAATVTFQQAVTGKDASDHLTAGHTVAEFVTVTAPTLDSTEETPENGPDSAEDDPEHYGEPGEVFARLVAREADRLRIQQAARELVAAENMPPAEPFDLGTLGEILTRPAQPAARIEGLLPWSGSALVVAQRKTGKTTLVLNLARSLITGTPFLGEFAVKPVTGRVAILNYEVSGEQLARWADDAQVPRDRLILANLRGRRNPFKHPGDLAELAAQLRALDVETLIVDPFGRAYPGASQNDAGEVQSFLVALDEFARAEVGALDLFLTAHAGWNGERTRGSSALEDWPDAIWTMTRDGDEDSDGARYLKAEGRDVDVPESRLVFDPLDRHLTVTGGSRRAHRDGRNLDALADHVVTFLTGHPGAWSGKRMEEHFREGKVPHQKGDAAKAAKVAAAAGRIVAVPGGWSRIEKEDPACG